MSNARASVAAGPSVVARPCGPVEVTRMRLPVSPSHLAFSCTVPDLGSGGSGTTEPKAQRLARIDGRLDFFGEGVLRVCGEHIHLHRTPADEEAHQTAAVGVGSLPHDKVAMRARRRRARLLGNGDAPDFGFGGVGACPLIHVAQLRAIAEQAARYVVG